MKENSVSLSIEWLGDYYKFTHYFGSEVVKVEKLCPNGFWGKADMIYKTLYFGHIEPLERCVNFFKSSKK